MRFLSRPIEHDAESHEQVPKRRKKSNTNEQEEISAFFIGRPPPLRVKDTNTRPAKATSHKKATDPQRCSYDDSELRRDRRSLPDDSGSHVSHNTIGRQVSIRSRRSAFTWPSSEHSHSAASARMRPASTVAAGDLARDTIKRDASLKKTTAPPLVPEKQDAISHPENLLEQMHQHIAEFEETRIEPKNTQAIHKPAADTISAMKPPQEIIMPKPLSNRDSRVTPVIRDSSSPFAKLLRACDNIVNTRASNNRRSDIIDEAPRLNRLQENPTSGVQDNTFRAVIDGSRQSYSRGPGGYISSRHDGGANDQAENANHYEDDRGGSSIYVHQYVSLHQPLGISTFDMWRPELDRQTVPDFHFSNPRHQQNHIRGDSLHEGRYLANDDSHGLQATSKSHRIRYEPYESMQFEDDVNHDPHLDIPYHGFEETADTFDYHDRSAPADDHYDIEVEFADAARYEDDQRHYDDGAVEQGSYPRHGAGITGEPGAAINIARADEGQNIVPKDFWRPNVLY